MKSQYITRCLVATVIFILSVTINYKIIHCRNVHDLTLTFRMGQGKCRYVNRKSIPDSLVDGNSKYFSLSVTISKILVDKMCMSVTLAVRMSQGQM